MGHVQAFRNYPVLKSVNLTDKEFKIYTDISFGNLFSTAIKSKYHTAQAGAANTDLIDEAEAQEVESVFVFEGVDEYIENPPKEEVKKVKEIEVPLKDTSEDLKDHSTSSPTPTRPLTPESPPKKKTLATQPRKPSTPMATQAPSDSHKPNSRIQKRIKSRSKPVSGINSLIERFYKTNSDLVSQIQLEVLEIAGSVPLQQKLFN